MKKRIALGMLTLASLIGCADVPPWTPGLTVDQMLEAQVANKNVIYSPAEGIASDVAGIGVESAITTYRESGGNPEAVQQKIQHVSTGAR